MKTQYPAPVPKHFYFQIKTNREYFHKLGPTNKFSLMKGCYVCKSFESSSLQKHSWQLKLNCKSSCGDVIMNEGGPTFHCEVRDKYERRGLFVYVVKLIVGICLIF